ncbi:MULTISPECIES: hypothetical protein [unclassified Streptomyces]|uniref:hypothetical protein n=1 Tax=unclassified Streptomyces TaxID=2593676 RepID=UPI002E2D1C1A|nr:hypothetical protein [Streptomyces sp. NBC_00223]
MTAGTVTYGGRLRDLEAEAFRTGRTLAGHSEQLAAIRTQQHTAPGNTPGEPGERTIAERLDTVAQRLDTIEQRLGTITDALTALSRALVTDPGTTG